MKNIPKFKIQKKYITSVRVKEPTTITLENGIILKGTAYSIADHPEFTKLRERLGQEGYINVEQGWWNGDKVLLPFKLNNLLFKTGEKFSCASALAIIFSLLKTRR